MKGRAFHDTAANADSFFSGGARFGSFTPLAALAVGTKSNSRYVPYFDDSPPGFAGTAPFNDYWERIVFIDNQGRSFTRKSIVLAIANQDGGAHIDPNMDEDYYDLSRRNSMGWQSGNNPPVTKAELAAVRQIAHEILRMFDASYPAVKHMDTGGMPAIATGILITTTGLRPPVIVKKVGWYQWALYKWDIFKAHIKSLFK